VLKKLLGKKRKKQAIPQPVDQAIA
jgi:hypothetical protein